MASSPGIPVPIGHGPNSGILICQTLQGCINGLFLRTYKSHLHLPVMQGKYLGPKHGRISDTNKLESSVLSIIPGNDKEPGAVRGAMDMGCLDGPVNLLLFR